jgi:hypothetical protein
LITSPSAGAPRQVDLRRAISSAYYGLFHFCLTAVADEFVGVTQRGTPRYALVYRSIDHQTLSKVCDEARKQNPTARYRPYLPAGGFGDNFREFTAGVIDLQQKRYMADYDPLPRYRASDARLVISAARTAVRHYETTTPEQQRAFLTLLICSPR